MKALIKVMKSVSDPTRVKMLKIIQHRDEICVCEIQAALGIAQSTASNHLKILEDAGLILSKKQGLWVNYSLVPEQNNLYAAIILENIKNWLNDDPDIVELVSKLPSIRRDIICQK